MRTRLLASIGLAALLAVSPAALALDAARPTSRPLGFEALAVESEAGVDVSVARTRLTRLVSDARVRLDGVTDARETLGVIADVAEVACPRLEDQVADGLYSGALALGICDCDILTVTYLTIADDLDLPLRAVFLPDHVLVLWDDGRTRVYWETTTAEERPEWLVRALVPDGAERAYLHPQTRSQMTGYFFQVRANYRFAQGDIEGARADFAEALRLNPTFVLTYYNRGRIRILLREYEGAHADLDQALSLDPTYVDARYSRALARVGLDRPAEALQDLDAVMEQAGPAADVAHVRGLALVDLGRDAEALASFSDALALDPEMALAYEARGGLHARTGRTEAALVDYASFLDHAQDPALAANVAHVQEQIRVLGGTLPNGSGAER